MLARGFSVLIISGSNLKLIFLSKFFFVVVFYTGMVMLRQAEILSESVAFSLRRSGSIVFRKRVRDLGKHRKILVLEHPLIWLKLRQCRFETLLVLSF